LRSRSKRRVSVRTPGGTTKVHYVSLGHLRATCYICGKELNGVPWNEKIIRGGAKSWKRPERMFGGHICHSCLSMLLKLSARASLKV